MTVDDVRRALDLAAVDPAWYEVGAGSAENRYCCHREGSQWVAYFFERGQRWDVRTFATENDACRFFMEWVRGSWLRLHGADLT